MFKPNDIITPRSNRTAHNNIFYTVLQYDKRLGHIEVRVLKGKSFGEQRKLTRPEHYEIVKKGNNVFKRNVKLLA